MMSFMEFLLESAKNENISEAGNAGNLFEYDFADALRSFSAANVNGESEDINEAAKKNKDDLLHEKAKEVLEKYIIKRQIADTDKFDIIVNNEGGENKKRDVLEATTVNGKSGVKPMKLSLADLNIGATLTDVTIIYEGKKYYLSLKTTGTVAFNNSGVGAMFKNPDSLQVFLQSIFNFSDKDAKDITFSIVNKIKSYANNKNKLANDTYLDCLKHLLSEYPEFYNSVKSHNIAEFKDKLVELVTKNNIDYVKLHEIFSPMLINIDSSALQKKAISSNSYDPTRGIVCCWLLSMLKPSEYSKIIKSVGMKNKIHLFQHTKFFDNSGLTDGFPTFKNNILDIDANNKNIKDNISISASQITDGMKLLLMNCIGYGYIYVHYINNDIEIINITSDVMEKMVNDLISGNIDIILPSDSNKTIRFKFNPAKGIIKNPILMLRNKQAGIIPKALLLQYSGINEDKL